MSQLITKVQYRNCEAGEFFEIASRTLEETIQLIKDYPWVMQREHASVHLTCPSVTIENHSGNFLKIGPYYNGKFCLYLLDHTGVLSNKIILQLLDCFQLITDFYNDVDISHNFVASSFIFYPKKHFVTNRFEYMITTERVFRFLLFPEIVLTVWAILFFLFNLNASHILAGLTATLLFLLYMIGVSVYLFINYYRYSRDLYLRMSKGHSKFLFGTKDQPTEYSKEDIEIVFVYYNWGHRCPWVFYKVFDICFKNGDRIRFPCLLVRQADLENKLPGITFEHVNTAIATC